MPLGIFISKSRGDHKEMYKKTVMHVQSWYFAEQTYCFLAILLKSSSNDDGDGNDIVNLKEKIWPIFVLDISLRFALSGSEWNSYV